MSSSSTRFWIVWGTGLAAWAAAMALASPYDLPLSRAVASRESLFGALVSLAGEWPGWIAIVGSLGLLIHARSRGDDSPVRDWRPLAWSICLMGLICPLLVTQALKLLWGRVRFIHLAAGAADFTSFYVPAGVGAGASFPSGHVAMAFVPSPIPFFFQARRQRLLSLLAWIVALVIGFGVAWGRIRYGKHYLTDTLFSAGFALLIAPLLLRWQLAVRIGLLGRNVTPLGG